MVDGGRLTARKARIADILAGNLEGSEAPRVSVVGVVVSVDANPPASFMMDDRSALIMVRQFDRQPTPVLGSVASVIGRVREYTGERYIACEITRQVDNKWLEVRALELLKQSSFITPTAPAPGSVMEERVEDVADEEMELIGLIRKLDKGTGVLVEDIIAQAGPDAEEGISLLLQRGDVFEVSPGKLKILE